MIVILAAISFAAERARAVDHQRKDDRGLHPRGRADWDSGARRERGRQLRRPSAGLGLRFSGLALRAFNSSNRRLH
jgi:hypothetical protein